MELLTLHQIAIALKQPESTIRSWRDRYDQFMPTVGDGRKKRFRRQAVDVFATIAELAAEGYKTDEIAERLSVQYQRFIGKSNENRNEQASLEIYSANKTLQRLTDAVEELIKQRDDNRQLRQHIEALEGRIRALEADRLPWYKRLGKRDPSGKRET